MGEEQHKQQHQRPELYEQEEQQESQEPQDQQVQEGGSLRQGHRVQQEDPLQEHQVQQGPEDQQVQQEDPVQQENQHEPRRHQQIQEQQAPQQHQVQQEQTAQRIWYYCHVCHSHFQSEPPSPDAEFVCPFCRGGFVEQFPTSPMIQLRTESDEPQVSIVRMRREPGPSSEDRQIVPYEGLVSEVLQNLGVDVNRDGGNIQVVIANPNNFWSRDQFDTIMGQLMEEFSHVGSPPLPEEMIDALPTANVTREQVEDSQLECAVCLEEFVVGEEVRQLPCMHVFHEPCLRPWLQRHSICPICRENIVRREWLQPGQDVEETTTLQELFSQTATDTQSGLSSVAMRGSAGRASSDTSLDDDVENLQ